MDAIRTVHNASENRYELYAGDELASLADYRPDGECLVFDHTETTPRFRGRGLAAKVVGFALDDVRERGLTVVPLCWFVAGFIDDNPEYGALLAPSYRAAG